MVVRRIPSAAAKNALPVLLGVVFKSESGPCPRSPLPPLPIQRGPGGLHEDDGVAPTLLESGGQRDVHVDGDGARGAAGGLAVGAAKNPPEKGTVGRPTSEWEPYRHTGECLKRKHRIYTLPASGEFIWSGVRSERWSKAYRGCTDTQMMT